MSGCRHKGTPRRNVKRRARSHGRVSTGDLTMHRVTLCVLLLLLASWPSDAAIVAVPFAPNAKVVYKFNQDYVKIWDDKGSGANVDVSIWKPTSLDSGFYPLGDMLVTLHDKPQSSCILVKDTVAAVVQPPIGYTEIWNDRSSGADHDVTVYSLTPPVGFSCLGHVAVSSYGHPPDLNAYRCVNSSHVTRGQLSLIWNDRGSGATRDFSAWAVENDPMLSGITMGTFLSHASHGGLHVIPSVLDTNKCILSSFIPISSDVALILYNMERMTEIWNDKGSGGAYDVSIWRAQGCCTLGDMAIGSYHKPTAVLLREVISETLRKPLSFERIWTDRGSGANRDVSIWKPVCPPSYHALGYVAEGAHNQVPSVESMRCVSTRYIVPGKWEWVYNDRKTGSNQDVSIWQAVSTNSAGQATGTFKAVTRHGDMDTTPYVLNSKFVSVQTGSPPAKLRLINFVYDFENQEVSSVNPLELTTRTVADNCKAPSDSPPLTVTRSIAITTTFTSSWTTSTTIAVGVEATFEVGIPLLGKSEVKLTSSISKMWQKTVTESKEVTETLGASINVTPGHSVSYVVVGKRYIGNIPWKATMITTFEDGSSNENAVSGIFEGMQVSEIRVSAESPVPCH